MVLAPTAGVLLRFGLPGGCTIARPLGVLALRGVDIINARRKLYAQLPPPSGLQLFALRMDTNAIEEARWDDHDNGLR